MEDPADFDVDSLFESDVLNERASDTRSTTSGGSASECDDEEEKNQAWFDIDGKPKRIRFSQSLSRNTFDQIEQSLINIGAVKGAFNNGAILNNIGLEEDILHTLYKALPFQYISKFVFLLWCVREKKIDLESWKLIVTRIDDCLEERKGTLQEGNEEKREYRFTLHRGSTSLMTTKTIANAFNDTMCQYNLSGSRMRGTAGLTKFPVGCGDNVEYARRKAFFLLDGKQRLQFCQQQIFGMVDETLENMVKNCQESIKIVVKTEIESDLSTEEPLVKRRRTVSIQNAAPLTNTMRFRQEYKNALATLKDELTCKETPAQSNAPNVPVNPQESETKEVKATVNVSLKQTSDTIIWLFVCIYFAVITAFVTFLFGNLESDLLLPTWDEDNMIPCFVVSILAVLVCKIKPGKGDFVLVILVFLFKVQVERHLTFVDKISTRGVALVGALQMLLYPVLKMKGTLLTSVVVLIASIFVLLNHYVRVCYISIIICFTVKRLNHSQSVWTIILSPFRDLILAVVVFVITVLQTMSCVG